jgi:hypothetical protein
VAAGWPLRVKFDQVRGLKEEHVLGGGQVPAPMFARVSQSASECCPERGRMPSRLAVGLKRSLSTDFDVKLMWNLVIFKKKLIEMQNPMKQPNRLCVR